MKSSSKKVAFIVSEYNPLHKGHIYHIEKTREMTGCEYVVAIMSGDYTQRGDATCAGVSERTTWALANGIDLVFVLPVLFASASADYFALGAMKVIQSLGIEGTVSFGSEHDDILSLKKIAQWLIDNEIMYYQSIREKLKTGISFATAREDVIRESVHVSDDFLNRSNVILGIEYIKNAIKLSLPVVFNSVKRQGAEYNDLSEQPIMSASGIRIQLYDGKDAWRRSVSHDVASYLTSHRVKRIDDAFSYLRYTITREGNEIGRYRDVNEGLENRIIESMLHAESWVDCINNVKSKRYSETHIRRAFTSIFLGITKSDFTYACEHRLPYVVLAGVSMKGRELIRTIKKVSDTPLISSLYRFPHKDYCVNATSLAVFQTNEIRSRRLYDLL